MLVAATATLWLLPVFDFCCLRTGKDFSVGACWSPVLIMFFPILYSKDLHFYTQYHPFLALFWHNWHLPTIQWGYLRYIYFSSYSYAFWCFKLILKLMSLGLGTTSIFGTGLPVPGTNSYPVEIPMKPLKICALWSEWETERFTWQMESSLTGWLKA